MTFTLAVKTCVSKSLNFGGRASCAEFWWFMLFTLLLGYALPLLLLPSFAPPVFANESSPWLHWRQIVQSLIQGLPCCP